MSPFSAVTVILITLLPTLKLWLPRPLTVALPSISPADTLTLVISFSTMRL